ncbi:MAG: LamG-like jellyroll fold domain-containing protein [Candidatus Paceibacterota bacterium]
MKKGFTFIELMVVITLILISSSLTLPITYNFFRESATRDQARNIESSLRNAQSSAITGKGDSSSGIRFSRASYTVFEGESYESRRSEKDMTLFFPVAVFVSGAREVVFQKTTGSPVFPGMIGHWEFNEETGDVVYDSSRPFDQNNGTVLGTYARTEGKEGLSLEFGGNTYVNILNSQNLNPEEEITISAWLNISSVGLIKIVAKGNPVQGTGYGLSISEDGSVVFSLGNGTSAEVISNNYSSELLGEWTHLVAVWDGQTLKQYINGELQPETKSFSGAIGSSEDNLILGQGLSGKMDDIRIYNYAFSGEDVKTDYMARKDDVAVGLKFGENRRYIIINSQGKVDVID